MYARENEVDFVFAALDALGAISAHSGVGELQRYLNVWAEQAGYSPLKVDNLYAGCTHGTLKTFARWYAALPNSKIRYPGDAMVDASGPLAVVTALAASSADLATAPLIQRRIGMTQSELADASLGFSEWLAAGKPSCGAGDTSDAVLLTDGSDVPVGPTTEEVLPVTVPKKLGTLAWVGIGLVVVVGGGVVYHYATKPKESPVRALPSAVRRRHTLY